MTPTILILLTISLKDSLIFSIVTLCLLLVFIKDWMEEKNKFKKRGDKKKAESKSEDDDNL
jgi:hypothetical protein